MKRTIDHDGVTLTFSDINLGGEDEFRDYLRAQICADSWKANSMLPMEAQLEIAKRVSVEAAGSNAGFLSAAGMTAMNDPRTIAKILEIAARPNYPNGGAPTAKDLLPMVLTREDECQDIVLAVIPTTAERRLAIQKKVAMGRAEEKAKLGAILAVDPAGQTDGPS